MLYSIGTLSREFNLSRSTLLYYDQIGLLTAARRTDANYRQYSEAERTRLRRICTLREAGVSLNQIKTILDNAGIDEGLVLEKRLRELTQEIRGLRLKQQLIVALLKRTGLPDQKILPDEATFVAMLKAAGLAEETLTRFHVQFEQNSPASHQFFLEFLGIPDAEIERLRESWRRQQPQ